jgi:glycine cleavage system H protein
VKPIDECRFDDTAGYSREHTWAKIEDYHVIIGITDYAQDQLGEIIYVELPELDATVQKDESFGFVESVKTASDLYAPVSGKVIAVNPDLADAPELVNEDPFGKGWMIKVLPSDQKALDTLLKPREYLEMLKPDA